MKAWPEVFARAPRAGLPVADAPKPAALPEALPAVMAAPGPCPAASSAAAEGLATLDPNQKGKHHSLDPRGTPPGGRLQIGTMAGFISEQVAGFKLECLAGFVGIRSHARRIPDCRRTKSIARACA